MNNNLLPKNDEIPDIPKKNIQESINNEIIQTTKETAPSPSGPPNSPNWNGIQIIPIMKIIDSHKIKYCLFFMFYFISFLFFPYIINIFYLNLTSWSISIIFIIIFIILFSFDVKEFENFVSKKDS